MKKLLKKLTVTGMAVIIAMGMAVSASAVCNHAGLIYTYEPTPPHYNYSYHSNGHGGWCQMTTMYRVIQTICRNCGLLNEANITVVTHSDSSCTNR